MVPLSLDPLFRVFSDYGIIVTDGAGRTEWGALFDERSMRWKSPQRSHGGLIGCVAAYEGNGLAVAVLPRPT